MFHLWGAKQFSTCACVSLGQPDVILCSGNWTPNGKALLVKEPGCQSSRVIAERKTFVISVNPIRNFLLLMRPCFVAWTPDFSLELLSFYYEGSFLIWSPKWNQHMGRDMPCLFKEVSSSRSGSGSKEALGRTWPHGFSEKPGSTGRSAAWAYGKWWCADVHS